jgi:hypothetical protein
MDNLVIVSEDVEQHAYATKKFLQDFSTFQEWPDGLFVPA